MHDRDDRYEARFWDEKNQKRKSIDLRKADRRNIRWERFRTLRDIIKSLLDVFAKAVGKLLRDVLVVVQRSRKIIRYLRIEYQSMSHGARPLAARPVLGKSPVPLRGHRNRQAALSPVRDAIL